MADVTAPRQILQPAQIDQVAQALLALAREVWVLRDRSRVLEAVLATHGLDVHAEIERFQPDAALQAELDAERDRFLAAVVQHLEGPQA
jgi:hypothetical protein